jgi:hypothetical protein
MSVLGIVAEYNPSIKDMPGIYENPLKKQGPKPLSAY